MAHVYYHISSGLLLLVVYVLLRSELQKKYDSELQSLSKEWRKVQSELLDIDRESVEYEQKMNSELAVQKSNVEDLQYENQQLQQSVYSILSTYLSPSINLRDAVAICLNSTYLLV